MYNTKLGFYKALCLIELQRVFIKLWNGNFERLIYIFILISFEIPYIFE